MMVLIAGLVLVLAVAGLAWLASWAWSLRADTPTQPRRMSRWPALAVVAVACVAITLLLRWRGLPVLLLFLPLVLPLGKRRQRCPSCGRAVGRRAETCESCGARLRG